MMDGYEQDDQDMTIDTLSLEDMSSLNSEEIYDILFSNGEDV